MHGESRSILAVLPSGQIDPGQLIEPGGLVAVVVVAGQDIQHGGQGGGCLLYTSRCV